MEQFWNKLKTKNVFPVVRVFRSTVSERTIDAQEKIVNRQWRFLNIRREGS